MLDVRKKNNKYQRDGIDTKYPVEKEKGNSLNQNNKIQKNQIKNLIKILVQRI